MTIETLRDFFLWCMILNFALLIFSSLMILGLRKWIFRLHGKMFGLPEEKIASANYKFISIYKILIFVFNVVPFIALCILS